MSIVLIVSYLGIAVLTLFVVNSSSFSWDQGKLESVILSVLWPVFYLMLLDWGFANLIDLAEAKLFCAKK